MLKWTLHPGGSELRVVMNGLITEKTPLAPLAEQAKAGCVTLDLAGVTAINSLGCREWLQLMRLFREKGVEVVLERCSTPIVHQLIMILGFEGNGSVRSFYAPYVCSGCGREELKLISLESGSVASILAGGGCERCGATLELDDLPEHYEKLATLFSPDGSHDVAGKVSQ
jgi:DNA-directed RNA polymerase subunit RPC12/RpoP